MYERIDCNVEGSNLPSIWIYDPADPFAITVQFDDGYGTFWVFSRDTLNEALYNKTGVSGMGDVLWAVEGFHAYLLISSPEGEAKVIYNTAQISKFLNKTLDMVPLNTETYDVDSALDAIFGEVA